MLIAPFLVGAVAGGFAWIQLPLLAFWLVGYFAFFATSQWLRSGRRAKWFPPVRFYALLVSALGLLLVVLEPSLIWWAPGFALPAGVGLWAAAHRRDRDLLVGLTTVIGSSLMTVVAYEAGDTAQTAAPWASGAWDHRPWLLAAVQAAYFGGTVFYVKSVIRERGNRTFFLWSIAFHLLCLLGCVWAALEVDSRWWWLAAIFAVLLGRAGWVWKLVTDGRRITPKAIGIAEAVATITVSLCSLVVL